jgi:hypothetical protein
VYPAAIQNARRQTRSCSASNTGTSRCQQQQQQQQQEEQQLLLVPALHTQLLQHYGISEKSLVGSLLDDAVAQSASSHKHVFAAARVLQLLLDGESQQQWWVQQNSTSGSAGLGNSSSSSTSGSSSKVAWAEMLTAVLLTTIEAQVRFAQQTASQLHMVWL